MPAKLSSGEAMRNQLYSNYKHGAKRRKLKFNLTSEEFTKITSLKCFYCNAEPSNSYYIKGRNGPYIYNGIDRKDNNKGYFPNNCVPCCWECNLAKGIRSHSEFMDWLERIYLCQKSI